jgi:hypothetical protein
VEWGPFLLAVIVAAGILFVLASNSPIFSGPKPLPATDAPSTGQVAPTAPDGSPQDEDAGEDPPVN